jgi:GLPGLI family protein
MIKFQNVFFLLLCKFSLYSQNYNIEYNYEDNNTKCKSNLYIISNKESLYRINDKREEGVKVNEKDEMEVEIVYNDKISKIFYSTQKESVTRIPLYKSEFLYSDLNSKIKYKLTGKNKEIKKYQCQEAKFELNGRKYTVWFTSDVAINFGPYKINGLPGLVVELFEETNKIKITLSSFKKTIDLKEFENYKIYILSKKSLSYTEYEKKLTQTMVTKKKSMISKIKEIEGATIEFSENQVAFTELIIDIPTNLVSELKKIKE